METINIEPKKPRQYILKDIKEGKYFYGNSTYGPNLSEAKIFDYHEFIGFFRTDKDAEIIFLDEEKGLELIVKERQKFYEIIDAKERELKEIKKGAERLHQVNKKMAEKYESECFREYNEASGISLETRKKIIKKIISGKI